jgi:hypothetical protein
MRNTQENFPEVPVENLSDWQVMNKDTGELFDVTSTLLDESFTEVSFIEGEEKKTVRFTPAAGEQLANDQYSVVFKYGGDPVIDHNGTQN